jgi:hypothetical protein
MPTFSDLLTLSREDLYELVWSKPVTELAKDFGLSDVALAKRCRKLGVPVPGRGYWARVEAGQTPRQPKLKKRAEELTDYTALTFDPPREESPIPAPAEKARKRRGEYVYQPRWDYFSTGDLRRSNAAGKRNCAGSGPSGAPRTRSSCTTWRRRQARGCAPVSSTQTCGRYGELWGM